MESVSDKKAKPFDFEKRGLRFYTNNDHAYVVDTDEKVYRIKPEGKAVYLPGRFFGDTFSDTWVTKEEAIEEAD